MREARLTSVSLDDKGRLFFDVDDGGIYRTFEIDLSVSDLHTLARYAIHAARDRLDHIKALSAGDTVLEGWPEELA